MNHIDTMKLALEWIEAQPEPRMLGALKTITALRQAIREAEEQAPWDAYDKAMAEQTVCDYCNHPLYAGTKCKNCGRVTEQAAIKRDLTPEQPAQQEPVAWTDLLKTADEIVRGKTVWKRFIDGTPLANDIAVWMADFVQQHTSPPASKPWVGLTPEDKVEILRANGEAAVLILAEAKLREKNAQSSKPLTDHQTMSMTFNHHWLTSMTLRDAYRLGIRDAEAAHGIKGDA